ncbi:hypothetical protein GCM10023205_78370 [Yinghuangia aomiensis]|uniref:LSDAT prokaryote domain-containing protein n=1 Tax=Yinghuangia aomiensis TaxID=676205 RepID=A0ABP9IBU2_9ACTN
MSSTQSRASGTAPSPSGPSAPSPDPTATAPGAGDLRRVPRYGLGGLSVPATTIGADGTPQDPDPRYVERTHGILTYRVGSKAQFDGAVHFLSEQPKPVVTLVGGAGGFAESAAGRPLFDAIVRSAARHGGLLAFGGGSSGALQYLGEAKARLIARGEVEEFKPLLFGVIAEGTLALPGAPYDPNARVPAQPDQEVLLIVPGDQWGDESRALAEFGVAASGVHGSATVLVNGGGITILDAVHRLESATRDDQGLFVVAGSGRAADAIAQAHRDIAHGRRPDLSGHGLTPENEERVARVAADPRTHVVHDAAELEAAIDTAMARAAEAAAARPEKRVDRAIVPDVAPARLPAVLPGMTPRAAYELGHDAVRGTWYETPHGPASTSATVSEPDRARWNALPTRVRKEALAALTAHNEAASRAPDTDPTTAYRAGVQEKYWTTHDAQRETPGPAPRAVAATRGFAPTGAATAAGPGASAAPPVSALTQPLRKGAEQVPEGPSNGARF